MDFNRENIIKILFPSIKNRFSDFSPYDFEDFIAQLFKDNGYNVEGTNYSGDFGADVIINKNGVKTCIQVKRYSASNKVGVKEINQIIGARDYYKCDKAMVITTSDFSMPDLTISCKFCNSFSTSPNFESFLGSKFCVSISDFLMFLSCQ